MSKLEFKDYEINAADLGQDNYMPDIKNVEYIHADFDLSDKIRKEDRKYFGKGAVNTILPYTIQDNYNRDRKPRRFRAAILENNILRAIFLPEMGGRLWSLFHKRLNRELLYVNPVFQPGNLALRNAWFSGGIEWNIGIKGHNPLTCSQMFAARGVDEKGNPVLRMYEFERIRGLTYGIDFILPDDSEVLYVRTTVENTSDDDKYMYWWSNIAVPETKGTRVIAPCSEAFISSYGENKYWVDMTEVPVPYNSNVDITYSTNVFCSQDCFFRIEDNSEKWIAAIDENGNGLIEFSTSELIGRKVFVWGQGQGGKNWSRWLSGKSYPYIEIQAGLARTQLEHIPMKAHSTMSWIEGYTAAVLPPQKIHREYADAVSAVEHYLQSSGNTSTALKKAFPSVGNFKITQEGSGWGYLENKLREITGKKQISENFIFPESSVKSEEKKWLNFILSGSMKEYDLTHPPMSFQTDPEWNIFFEKQIIEGRANAYMYLQYGVFKYANGFISEAYGMFEKSNALKENPWALRNLSMIEKNEYKNPAKAMEYIEKAIALNRECRGLVVNCAQVMLYAKAYRKWIKTFESLSEGLKGDGRLLIYKAMALTELGEYEKASGIINPSFVLYDIKEGEVSVSHIWEKVYDGIISRKYNLSDREKIKEIREKEYPLPAHLDFRMDK